MRTTDISFCASTTCTIKEKCQRHYHPKRYMYSQARFKQNKDKTCDYLIELSKSEVKRYKSLTEKKDEAL